jgi:hypothetical protein
MEVSCVAGWARRAGWREVARCSGELTHLKSVQKDVSGKLCFEFNNLS